MTDWWEAFIKVNFRLGRLNIFPKLWAQSKTHVTCAPINSFHHIKVSDSPKPPHPLLKLSKEKSKQLLGGFYPM